MANPAHRSNSLRKMLGGILSAPVSVLWIGFTGLFLLTAIVGVDAATSIRKVEVATAALRAQSRQRDALLDQLRAELYRSATVTRDYLLDPDDARAADQKSELEQIRVRSDSALHSYEQTLPQHERLTFDDLRGRIEAYWSTPTVPA